MVKLIMTKKEEISSLLLNRDFDSLKGLGSRALRTLISLTYDRKDPICWQAIEAIGVIASSMSHEEARRLVQRILWMMREESGGNPWSAPDILGEIVRAKVDELSDIAPIIVSFHDEEIFTEGVLRAIGRIAEVEPELVRNAGNIALGYIGHRSASIRGFAVYAVGLLRPEGYESALKERLNDSGLLDIYRDGRLMITSVGALALEALEGSP